MSAIQNSCTCNRYTIMVNSGLKVFRLSKDDLTEDRKNKKKTRIREKVNKQLIHNTVKTRFRFSSQIMLSQTAGTSKFF